MVRPEPIGARHLEHRFWIKHSRLRSSARARLWDDYFEVRFGTKTLRTFKRRELAEAYRMWLFEMPHFHKYFGGDRG